MLDDLKRAFPVFRWKFRRRKYYNPRGLCIRCECPIPKHSFYCSGCAEANRLESALATERMISIYDL
jgi:hypothetical protein